MSSLDAIFGLLSAFRPTGASTSPADRPGNARPSQLNPTEPSQNPKPTTNASSPAATAELSPRAIHASRQSLSVTPNRPTGQQTESRLSSAHQNSTTTKSEDISELELTEAEREQVQKLRDRDAEVRNHEQAHLAAAGPYARGGINLEYQSGPDGKRYAVGGHVNVDTSPIPNDPQATIEKMAVIKRAAFAPAEPSSADRAVAAKADRIAAKARRELAEQRRSEAQGEKENSVDSTPPRDHGRSTKASDTSSSRTDSPYERRAEAYTRQFTRPGLQLNLVG